MIKVAVVGAAGRMGQRLVANVMAAEDMTLAGALEAPASPAIGKDSGMVAGCGENGVKITASPEEALANADAVINFGTSGVLEITRIAVARNATVVIGTTALTDAEKAELKNMAEKGARIVFAPNMSIGVNLLFHLCRQVLLSS